MKPGSARGSRRSSGYSFFRERSRWARGLRAPSPTAACMKIKRGLGSSLRSSSSLSSSGRAVSRRQVRGSASTSMKMTRMRTSLSSVEKGLCEATADDDTDRTLVLLTGRGQSVRVEGDRHIFDAHQVGQGVTGQGITVGLLLYAREGVEVFGWCERFGFAVGRGSQGVLLHFLAECGLGEERSERDQSEAEDEAGTHLVLHRAKPAELGPQPHFRPRMGSDRLVRGLCDILRRCVRFRARTFIRSSGLATSWSG